MLWLNVRLLELVRGDNGTNGPPSLDTDYGTD